MKTVAIYGGAAMDRQVSALHRGTQVVVGTPGRVLDLIRRGELRLESVQIVILDEADRMLDMGFIVDVETILARCPRQRQTALFSATMPYAILRICDRFMRRDADHVAIRPELRTVETTRQLVYFVAEQDKVAAMVELADTFGFDRLLVFRHTQIGVDRLTMSLKRRGRNVAALHGGLSQREREKTLAAFKAGQIQFLVATNVASRGLDIMDLPYVLSYDIPEDADTYIHRVGPHRSGRQGGDRHHLRRGVGPRRLAGHQDRGRDGGRGRRAQPVPMTTERGDGPILPQLRHRGEGEHQQPALVVRAVLDRGSAGGSSQRRVRPPDRWVGGAGRRLLPRAGRGPRRVG